MIASNAIFRKMLLILLGQAFGLSLCLEISVLKKHKICLFQFLLIESNPIDSSFDIDYGIRFIFKFWIPWSVTESSASQILLKLSKEMLDIPATGSPASWWDFSLHKAPWLIRINAVSYQIFWVTPFASRFFLQNWVYFRFSWFSKLVNTVSRLLEEALPFKPFALQFISSVNHRASRLLTTDTYFSHTSFWQRCIFGLSYQEIKKAIPFLILSLFFLGLGFWPKVRSFG